MDNRRALAEENYQAPTWLYRKGRFMDKAEILERFKNAKK
jgi:protein involved in sex pheromone biosynthesis